MGAGVVPATPSAVAEAGKVLRRGGLVAFPTETVYGLGANGLDAGAVARIFAVKGRPADNPLILHVADRDGARVLARLWPPAADRLTERFWPGPLTVVVPAGPDIPEQVRAGLPTVALRCPRHPVAQALIRTAGVPVAAPSANRSGRPSPTTAAHVAADLDGAVDLILDGGPAEVGVESTVVDVSVDPPVLLRPGGLPPEAVEAVVGRLRRPAPGEPARSPGMRYRHYAPERPVRWLRLPFDEAITEIRERYVPGTTGVLAPDAVVRALEDYPRVSLGSTAESAAQALFSGLRALDRPPITVIVAVWNDETGLGHAICNRLEKAAAKA
jgi:L-threonylcarbamoyladenylate synthase